MQEAALGGSDSEQRLFYPATTRNREPLLAVLQRVLPPDCTVVELASGSGEHAVFFAPRLPGRVWLPSDLDPAARASVAAWTRHAGCDAVLPPLSLDALDPRWPAAASEAVAAALPPVPCIGAVLCVNMIHISPWEATLGLLTGCARLLPAGGRLVLYGPFMRGGEHTAPSNADFDASLRSRDARWGVRDLDVVAAAAAHRGLDLVEVVAMPANNLTVIFDASGAAQGREARAGGLIVDSLE